MKNQLSQLENLEIKDNMINYSIGEKIDVSCMTLVDTNLPLKYDISNFRIRKVSKIVFDKDENNIDKLTTVFSTINSLNSDLFYIFKNTNKSLHFYIGISTTEDVALADKSLGQVFDANFSGCKITDYKEIRGDSSHIKDIENTLSSSQSITMSTAIPSLKDKDEKKENFVQGMEKFLLAMQDKDYTAILLAKNISNMIETRKGGYEELYSSLFPLMNKDISIGLNISKSEGTNESKSFSQTLNESTTKTLSSGTTTSKSLQKQSRLQKAQSLGRPFVNLIIASGISLVDKKGSKWFDSENISNSSTSNESNGKTKSIGSTKSNTYGVNLNHTEGESFQSSIKHEDKFIKNKIDAIDMQLDRINHSKNYGMYDFAAYFISDDISTSNTAANIYNSLIRGDESYLGSSYVIPFDSENSKTVCKYLANFEHPKFNIDEEEISITSMINSKELAIAMNLPKKSLHGLLVKESVEFGREIRNQNDKESINIGNIYHLGKSSSHDVNLPIKDFSMHTLVTGATGSGKSTTTYKLIDELRDNDIKFLVIEPTKGEYKHIFGNEKDVSVYGTNNKHTPLLKINPFSFSYDEIHILEHIDRLVEIFNACWPMYAAMPAVLKDAILNSYEDCGWDLEDSVNKDKIYPSFDDVLNSLEYILENSAYSDNTKSDYKGALSTRIDSLTKGLVGKIFDKDELEDKKLFYENVIIDISRVGSSETKSLIMGILLLKLNQYRMATGKMNENLKHITVLEEAHHLLPKTSKETSSESGNIKGKAVEMLSNSIAEMRTYGEGFIIVDQSPNMLDISAIRNTNTKIIMRLSELEDRNDIGKSATLTDEQIDEIPKLEQGVAVVYQNGWEDSILCKISKSDIEDEFKRFKYIKPKNDFNNKEILTNIITLIALKGTKILLEEREKLMLDYIEKENIYLNWSGNDKHKLDGLIYIEDDEFSIKEKAKLINYLLNGKKVLRKLNNLNNINNIEIDFRNQLKKQINISNEILEYQIIQLIKIDNSYEGE
ncbi:MAG: DUF87 domain-containing protein, partial [Campylobacterota bacterium]|nr:DUF87 domain-containing protein [Campylobacterota bacterium]